MTSVRSRRAVAAIIVSILAAAFTGSAATASSSASHSRPAGSAWVWPLDPVPTVVRAFDAPADPWGAGHRGVDLLGSAAQPVLSIGAGDVTFARAIAGRGVVVVRHGILRSTYEPVTANVRVGDHVDAGEVIGLLQTTLSHCFPDVCLHLGLKRGDVYLDPLSVLGPRPVRLKPLRAEGSAATSASGRGLPAARDRLDATGKTAEPRRSTEIGGLGPGRAVAAALAVAVGLVASSLVVGWRHRGQARG